MLNKYFYNLSVIIVGIVTSVFILTCVGTLFHIPVNPFYVLIPFIGGLYYIRKQSPENIDFLKQVLILLLIIMVSYYLAVSVWDFSWDGRGSHLATAILYKNGWLPVYQNYADFAKQCHVYAPSAFWGNCYLHLTEIIDANIYKLTNLIESAKSVNFIMLSCLFMYSFVIFKEFLPDKKFIPVLLSAIFVLNPVCICQWFTNYIDLMIYISFSLLLLTIMKTEHQQSADKKDVFLFVCSSLMLAMTKFTGSMYLFLIYLIYFIYLLLMKRDVKKFIKTALVVGGLVVVTGVSPFYTNFRDYGHPFHPLFGSNKINITDENIPYGFENMSTPERFFRSTFSDSVNSMNDAVDKPELMKQSVNLKIPFTIHKRNFIYSFCFADVRIAGFGYYWSGILLLSLLFLPFIRFRNQNEKNIFWLATSVIIFTTFANPHCWWARYVPQLWLFPVFIILFGMLQENYRNKASQISKALLLYFIILSFFANAFLVMNENTLYSLYISNKIKFAYYYLDSIKKPQDKIYVMIRPEWENMVIADETVIPHLQERYGKNNIIFVPYDESRIVTNEFFPIQYAGCVINRPCFFVKPEK